MKISLRALNRAHLARQMLLEPAGHDAAGAVERLAGLQAQWPPSPYLALWNRVRDFDRADLRRSIDRRKLLKATLMRATLHLVPASEYPAYALVSLEGRAGRWGPPGTKPLRERLPDWHARALDFAAKEPRTRAEIAKHLEPHLPKNAGHRAWAAWAVLSAGSLVLEPCCAHEDHRRDARYVAAPAKLRREPSEAAAHDLVVKRYLAAFGPATLQDLASWSGGRAAPLRSALERLHTARFEDERCRELFDLPDAPRPHPDTPAPVRFLPRFDAAILGHAAPERERILPNAFRKAVIFAAEVRAVVLVDGFVAATWGAERTSKRITLTLKALRKLSAAERSAIRDEGRRVASWLAPDAPDRDVRV